MNNNNHKVYAAINAMQNALKAGIPKDQKNAVQGYNFRGIDDIYNVVGPLLPEHKLIIFPRMISRECSEHKNAKGNTLFRVVVTAEYDFTSAEDGSCKVVQMYGEAMDSGDKATNKAMSAAYKYACIQTFSIPVTGEPDADSETHEVAAEASRLPQPPKGSPRAPQRESTASIKATWQGFIDWDEKKTFLYKGKKANGEPYSLYRVTLDSEKGEPERTATTFSEELWQKVQATGVEEEVLLYTRPNQKKEGTFELIDIKPVQQELKDDQPWE